MTRKTLTFRFCYPQIDKNATADFLETCATELYLPDREAVEKVVETVFEQGGVFAGYDPQRQMQAMMGFFFGDPAEGYADRSILYMYVAAISDQYRLTRAFHAGLLKSLTTFQEIGLEQIRLQAKETDPYTNKLYRRFARPISKGVSLRGQPVMTYGGPIEDAISYLTPGKGRLGRLSRPQARRDLQHAECFRPLT